MNTAAQIFDLLPEPIVMKLGMYSYVSWRLKSSQQYTS
jgi:hypothetical protein